jgi:hypothetical protein
MRLIIGSLLGLAFAATAAQARPCRNAGDIEEAARYLKFDSEALADLTSSFTVQDRAADLQSLAEDIENAINDRIDCATVINYRSEVTSKFNRLSSAVRATRLTSAEQRQFTDVSNWYTALKTALRNAN